MLTTTHAILNTTLLGRKERPERNWPLVLGASLPDIPGFLYLAWKIVQLPQNHWVWDHSYYSPAWALWVDWGHSIPLALTSLALFLAIRYRAGSFFCISMFLHDVEDFFVHSIQSHRHFLPFSDYRFISPVSCHELEHHAALMVPLEWALVVGCCFLLWRRQPPLWLKRCLIFLCVFQGFGALYFLLSAQ